VSKIYFIGFGLVLVAIELIYFRVARVYHILDEPNNRSLHEKPTIRGGGIIFPVAILLFYFFTHQASPYFIAALVLVSIVGLMDDIQSLSRTVRFGIQALAMVMVFYDLNVFDHSWWIIILLMFIATGTVNAYNFMDGINGITSGYSLVVLGSLYYINNELTHFVNNDLLVTMMIALFVFSFFNFRTKAICFAGDVGSLSIGFAILYLILELTMKSHNYIFILLLAVYGTDSVLTVVHRLMLRQNIFKAHRLHLYQVVIASTGMKHLPMTLLYMAAQVFVSGIVIFNLDKNLPQQYTIGAAILMSLSLLYIVIKRHFYKTLSNAV
jgi:UDP-N-acetylmuramyl pentapeptide phosphotransferase/UDP-N-acetylglucosamine-1-phosphate transferase